MDRKLNVLCRILPISRARGLEALDGKRRADDISRSLQGTHMTQCNGLNENISDRRTFDRAGQNSPADGIRSELIEQPILAPAPNDMELRNTHPCHIFQLFERTTVSVSEAFEDAADKCARRARHRLA